ncbi:SnoaL-like protein [Ruminiclostridium sufflavum DSM 19573]|uniref:SnoaL-like protein n=1 Tax=Ruminiclostridium sufflavum DSM 19573 TaxID=1121337 RepID=A0A318XRQ7_9FIRM|nr:nuclear transport factor 2 family protein [Ruminiclostridium sufflavum]PYG90277.1 SnoaL-like protein [Ruminiclostridium sufflavum DSM 19573]
MDIDLNVIDELDAEEFTEMECAVEKLLSVWEIKNLRGAAAIFHDDQHIGQKRRELQAVKHPSVDVKGLMDFRRKAVVDNLEGNMLIHPLTTPVIEVNADCTVARGVWWSLGIEGLSKFREEPMAIISLGMVPGTHIKEDGEWRILSGAWQRTTKNEYKKGWVRDMQPTNTRPPLTPEQDRNFLGKYAYMKDEVRKPSPEPPHKDTFDKFPEETDNIWLYINLKK